MAKGQELAEGEGKQAVEEICTSCHSLTPIVSARHTNAEWRAVVDNMASLGAQGNDEDFNAVVEYLSGHYGKSLVDWRVWCAGGGVVFGGVALGCFRKRWRRQRQAGPTPG